MAAPSKPYVFPLVLPSDPFQRTVKCTLGRLVLGFNSGLKDRFLAGHQPTDRWQRFALQALVQGMEARGDTAGIARLQQHYWSAADVVAYHDGVDDRFNTMFLQAHGAIVDRLVGAAQAAGCKSLLEIGCGSGRVLAHFAQHAPSIDRFIGVDLSPQQVSVNQQRFPDPRIQFVAGDAVEHIKAHGGSHRAYLSYGGVLEYLPQARLQGLLDLLATRSPVVFGIVEPVAADFDLQGSVSVHYGAERSLSHPYAHMFRQAGFDIVWQEESRVDGHRFLMLVAKA